VRDYFGDGDECHMAFHFPLMPRMFMALRQEDRHPITEILDQTPEIPDNCQWALFLRNHDELTLEMVTDEERDYMYSVYAADPQMRLNVGIRRRLAPLVENSRRRIELLNALLFSMPGTPIIYYGDELGMGDNIYLGDRNGVRTPMQWTGDRNGGFSRADTARLTAPPIVDPVYGYQAINVEAQERYPFSLLNWMKRIIALRRQHRVFGRGSIEFVNCANRKILAYVRRDANETVLVVANLSRGLQPAELNLSAFSGLTAVEMFGRTQFPRIADAPYFLTLGSYAVYWFSLVSEPLQLTQTVPDRPEVSTAGAADLPALLVGVNWEAMLGSATRALLERRALIPYLQRQRWYASKTRTVRDGRISDSVLVRGGSNPAFLTIASITFTDGWRESYVLPLAMLSDEAADRVVAETPAAVMARITGARKGVIVDGLLDDDLCSRLVEGAGAEREFHGGKGSVRGLRAAGIGDVQYVWSRSAIDQSNSVVFLDGRYVLKLFRRIEPGPNPEFEIGGFLTAQGFTQVPALAAALLYERPNLEPGTLAVVQSAVVNQGTGWSFTVDELQRYYERVAARISRERAIDPAADTGDEPPPFFAALESWYLSAASTLGHQTADLHLALAGGSDPAFAPDPLDERALRELAGLTTAHANQVFTVLADRRDRLPEACIRDADVVLGARAAFVDAIAGIGRLRGGGTRIRVHGDYHLGQVLRTEEDFVILDFEGEPGRTLSERRAKASPLKDVAGMLRSFQYAAEAALIAFEPTSPVSSDQLAPWAASWERWVSRAFLSAYRDTMADSRILPSGTDFEQLLHGFMIDKALYELAYELNNRPDWARIPLHALVTLALRLQS
jgi:maltose alpha-D-glucosyltransferase/alpha-amylase